MKIRTDVADLLRAGYSDRVIAQQLHTCAKDVAAARATLGLPKSRSGKTPAKSLEDAFRSHCEEVDGGHLKWAGHINGTGLPGFRWGGRQWTARRVAFEIQHGRPPAGKTATSCDLPLCVAPAHVRELGVPGTIAAYGGAREPVSDDAIAKVLLAGGSQNDVIRQLRVGSDRARAVRERLGLPRRKPGTPPEPVEETFARRTRATDDGHLIWTGHDLGLRTVEGASYSAARWSFQQQYGRPPVGTVTPGCGTPRCVHPAHVEDRPMREALDTQLTSIFGSAA